MAPLQNTRHLFKKIPDGYPIPGETTVTDTSQTIDLDTVPLDGGFLIKTLVVSIDPYLRGKMRDEKIKSYSPAFRVGEPLANHGIGKVLRSENPGVKAGDYVYAVLDFAEYQIKTDAKSVRVLKNEEKLPWSLYIGVAGMPGKTAYHGWSAYSEAKKGEIAFISGGAGPVGSFVIQLAKEQGLKVIASAGSDAKVEFIKSVGADVAFNYKTTSTREVLEKEGPIDIYWDNVGGETLEAALQEANIGGRFIECGMISQYNNTSDKKSNAPGIRNLVQVVSKSLQIHGFLVSRLAERYDEEFYKTIPAKIARGEIKYKEHISRGLDSVGQAIYDVQTGGNDGKSVVIVADD